MSLTTHRAMILVALALFGCRGAERRDASAERPASYFATFTSDRITYEVGSPSAWFRVPFASRILANLAVEALVEEGRLDLDRPVTHYLANFAPSIEQFSEPTVRHVLEDRAGLVREAPGRSSLRLRAWSRERAVESLRSTRLSWAPGSGRKESLAGTSVLECLVEEVSGEAYEDFLDKVLRRAGIDPFARPAGGDATTVLAAHVRLAVGGSRRREVLVARGPLFQGPDAVRLGQLLLRRASSGKVDPLFSVFAPSLRLVRSDGAFTAALVLRPQEDRGAIAIEASGRVEERVELAARAGLGDQAAIDLAARSNSDTLDRPDWPSVAGLWVSGPRTLEITVRGDALRVESDEGVEEYSYDQELGAKGLLPRPDGTLEHAGRVYRRAPEIPPPPPAAVAAYAGEYVDPADLGELAPPIRAIVHERGGRLFVQLEEIDRYLLEPQPEPDHFRLEDRGRFRSEHLRFERDDTGQVSGLTLSGVFLARLPRVGEGESTRFPLAKPIEDYRQDALALEPPEEEGPFRPSELVELGPPFRLDIRYATRNNFLGVPVYESPRAFLQAPAHAALLRVEQKLHARGYGLVIFDAYRPWFVTRVFWDATPEALRDFVANPDEGSRHNRGAAVDLGLYELSTGDVVDLGAGYDEFAAHAHAWWPGGTSRERWHRRLLRRTMESEGFAVYAPEWWHFDHETWREYPLGNRRFEEL